uniref:Ig-like domain-containing protein n=1 Tax=Pseudonaja textilis TaxID=8673 RepID=A0A670ZHC5_PSETE
MAQSERRCISLTGFLSFSDPALSLPPSLPLSFKGINGQSAWIQPPSSSVSPGGTISISCQTQSTNSIRWNRQKEGEAPRFVHCDGCSNRGEGIPNRFTATRSGTTGSLTITNAEAEDEADYYCMWLLKCRIFFLRVRRPDHSENK